MEMTWPDGGDTLPLCSGGEIHRPEREYAASREKQIPSSRPVISQRMSDAGMMSLEK